MLYTACFTLLCLALGCQEKDRDLSDRQVADVEYKNAATPEWTFDRPFYIKPADSTKPVKNFDGPPKEIYTQKRELHIPRPAAGNPRKAPRVAIWLTKDNGLKWERIGYFGLQQSVFAFQVKRDGDYGIRFIGPGIPPAKCKPPKPHMVFHVDSEAPEITVFVEPDCEVYQPGQTLTIEWTSLDPNLKANDTRISVCLDHKGRELRWLDLGKSHPESGKLDLVIPKDAIDKTMVVRVSAVDQAENYGFGYSCLLPVVCEPTPTPAAAPATQPAKAGPKKKPSVKISATQPAKGVVGPEGPEIPTSMPVSYPGL